MASLSYSSLPLSKCARLFRKGEWVFLARVPVEAQWWKKTELSYQIAQKLNIILSDVKEHDSKDLPTVLMQNSSWQNIQGHTQTAHQQKKKEKREPQKVKRKRKRTEKNVYVSHAYSNCVLVLIKADLFFIFFFSDKSQPDLVFTMSAIPWGTTRFEAE